MEKISLYSFKRFAVEGKKAILWEFERARTELKSSTLGGTLECVYAQKRD